MRRTKALASVKFYQMLSIFFFIRLIILEDFIRLILGVFRLGCSFSLATALNIRVVVWWSGVRSHLFPFRVCFHFEAIAMMSLLFLLQKYLLSILIYVTIFFIFDELPWTVNVTFLYTVCSVMLRSSFCFLRSSIGVFLIAEYSTLWYSIFFLLYSLLFHLILFLSRFNFHCSLYDCATDKNISQYHSVCASNMPKPPAVN